MEVLEEEKELDSTPFMKKRYYEEVFDRLKCEAELISSDDQGESSYRREQPSEDQEIEETKFLIE